MLYITLHDVCFMQITATMHQEICRGLADCHFLVVVDITIFVYSCIVGVLVLVDRGGDAYTAYTRYIQLAYYDSCTLCFACIRCMNLCTICIPNTYVYTRDRGSYTIHLSYIVGWCNMLVAH